MIEVTLPCGWSARLDHQDLIYVVTIMGDKEAAGRDADMFRACQAAVRTARRRGESPPAAQSIHAAIDAQITASLDAWTARHADEARARLDIRPSLPIPENPC